MRRLLLLCAVLLVGCAKTETPATDTSATEPATSETAAPVALSLADVAGVWNGTVSTMTSDSAVAVAEITAAADASGWMMRVASAANPTALTAVPFTSVVAAGDSIVAIAGPFPSVLRPGQEVTTHTVYRMQGENMVGSMLAVYPASGDSLMLRTMATRAAAH